MKMQKIILAQNHIYDRRKQGGYWKRYEPGKYYGSNHIPSALPSNRSKTKQTATGYIRSRNRYTKFGSNCYDQFGY